MLVPTERGELSGPFFQATHDAFKTPFFSQDFSTKFGSGGAGRYGRDDGGTFWGSVEPGFIKGYAAICSRRLPGVPVIHDASDPIRVTAVLGPGASPTIF